MVFLNCIFQRWILQTFAMSNLGRGLLGGDAPSVSAPADNHA